MGRHKKRRGFPATPNYSLHRFYSPELNQILGNYIGRINAAEQCQIDEINAGLPIKDLNMEIPLVEAEKSVVLMSDRGWPIINEIYEWPARSPHMAR